MQKQIENSSLWGLRKSRWFLFCQMISAGILLACGGSIQAQLRAGVAKVDIVDRTIDPAAEFLWVKALVLDDGRQRYAIITLDVVAISEIGPIKGDFLASVRAALQTELQIAPPHLLVNASHCHGIVCQDVEQKTIEAVRLASENLVPVHVGSGVGFENRIMENRRLLLVDGRQADVRHAYSLPPDEQVAAIGPIDPEIGILKLNRHDGSTLAVIYNFACHPIQGTPRTGGNTADLTGYASQVIEDQLDAGAMAFFLQGCAGDINPVYYKDPHHPRDAELLGNQLGLSALKAIRKITCQPIDKMFWEQTELVLPRADHRDRIARLEQQQLQLLQRLQGTSLNLEVFIPLLVKYRLKEKYPSYYSHGYLHDQLIGRNNWEKLDAENRANLEKYIRNIEVMEELTRVQTNLRLLQKHQRKTEQLNTDVVRTEVIGIGLNDFRLITFPGELTVQIGLNIKQRSEQDHTFVAGYTNGYVYYAPTTEQQLNTGCAQEDCDSFLGPGWQPQFELHVQKLLQRLEAN